MQRTTIKFHLFFLSIFLFSQGFTSVYSSHPPVLKEISESYFRTVKSNTTLQISCDGTHSMLWKRRTPNNEDSNNRLTIIQSEDISQPVYKHKSTMTLKHLDFKDTGWYSCYYIGTTDFNADANYQLNKNYEDTGNTVSSVHFMVDDDLHGFVDMIKERTPYILLYGQHFTKTVIPCLQIRSLSRLALWKLQWSEEKNKIIRLQTDVPSFEIEGFVLRNFTSYNEGFYTCHSHWDGGFEEITVNLLSYKLLPPVIDMSEAKNPISKNETFTLKCSVNIGTMGEYLFPEWSYPNKNEAGERIYKIKMYPEWKNSRTNQQEIVGQTVYDVYTVYQELAVYLVVQNSKSSDSGKYICTVTDRSHNVERTTANIFVYDPESPAELFFTTESESLVYDYGDNFTLVVTVNAFPNVTIAELYWEKNDELLNSDDHYKMKTEGEEESIYRAVLKIESLHRSDAANYTLYGKTKDGIYSISILLKVKYKPFISLKDVETIYAKGQEYSLECHVYSYPPAVVWWRWTHCEQINKCTLDNNVWTDVNINGSSPNEEYMMEIPSVQNPTFVVSYLNITARQTGYYMCVANNTMGEEDALISITVTDRKENITQHTFSSDSQIDEETSLIAIPGVFGALFILMISICLIHRSLKRKKRKKEFDFMNHNQFKDGDTDIFNPNLPLQDQIDLLPYENKWEFPKDRLKLGKTIGEGAFGRVVKAEATGLVVGEDSTVVAVKMLKQTADKKQRKALVAELKILTHIGKHLNIANLLGAVTKNLERGELYLIVEYCYYGNLRHFLLKNKDTFIDQLDHTTGELAAKTSSLHFSNIGQSLSDGHDQEVRNDSERGISVFANTSSNSTSDQYSKKSSTVPPVGSGNVWCDDESVRNFITTFDLLCFSFQCARGMEFLASRKLIHRDLAARNVLLAKDYVVKICDFGLAKDCYKDSNYIKKSKGLLPMKWMAIESIQDRIFTSKSDVWSFGIVLWEIFTLGRDPYSGVEMDEKFFKKLKNGYRMEKPELAVDTIYQLMKDCWLENPNERPEFSYLVEKIGALLEARVRRYYMELNIPSTTLSEEVFNEINYLQMSEQNAEEYTSMDSSGSKQITDNPKCTYENIFSVSFVGIEPKQRVPMEEMPMIQFESMSEPQEEHISQRNNYQILSNVPVKDDNSYLNMEIYSQGI